MKGRQPKSHNEKKLLGFPGHHPVPVIPESEKGLKWPDSLLPGARAIWRRLVPELQGVRKTHVDAIADMCNCIYRVAELEKLISDEGVIVDGTKGKRKNPALQVLREYRQAFTRWCSEFGLTPVSAMRLGIQSDEDDDPDGILD